jgi:hypothetical protein
MIPRRAHSAMSMWSNPVDRVAIIFNFGSFANHSAVNFE